MDGSTVMRWDLATNTATKTVGVAGRGKSMLALPGKRLLVLSERYGAQHYTILDDNLTVLSSEGPAQVNRLANISVQADVGTGADALVPGFVIGGTQPKTLLIRGVGPGLAGFGIKGTLADPQLTLFDGKNAPITSNDNWSSLSNQRELKDRTADLYAFKLADGSKDAVLLVTLAPGLYTAEIKGVASGTGRAIMEVYDADEAPGDARAVNLSSRCKVTAESSAVGGFVIHGDKTKKVLIRGIGPALTKYSVPGVLADPKLRLFSGQTVIAENNDWSADAAQATALRAAFLATGAFVLDDKSKDAALIVELAPGNYTVWLDSNDKTGGVGLLELYEVP